MAHIPEYQDRANGIKPVTYPTPELEDILDETFGIAIYQEQIMMISQVLGGYSPGEADVLRKLMGKKSEKVMNETLPGLRQAVLDNGYDESIANYVIATIEPFVGYGLTPFK